MDSSPTGGDAATLGHPGPFGGFARQERDELVGRRQHHRRALVGQLSGQHRFNRATGFDLRREWSADMDSLVKRGWALRSPERFQLTHQGLRFADNAAEMFLR